MIAITKVRPRILGKYISYFYVLSATSASSYPTLRRYMPDGNMELWINLGAPLIHMDQRENTLRIPQALIGGLHSEAFSMQSSGKLHLIGAFIKPGAAPIFINDRTDSYKNVFLEADGVFPNGIDLLTERLRGFSNPVDISECLELFLAKRIESRKEPCYFMDIQRVRQVIDAHFGSISLKNIHIQANMGERNFRKIFTEYVGFRPKEYSRIVRTKQALKLLRCGMSIFDVSFELGYHDPAHLCNDFSEITGVSPSTSRYQLNSIDLEYLNNPVTVGSNQR